MVDFHPDSKIAVIEGDEYLTSPIDPQPKFFHYKPHIALISGIAWDHINVFPTFENYVEQFKKFTELIEVNGSLVFFKEDENLSKIADTVRGDINKIPYSTHPNETIEETSLLIQNGAKTPLKIFGKHNLQNIQGAQFVCKQLGISDDTFYEAIANFKGTKKRLELITEGKSSKLFIDFAHSPSKVKATLKSVREQYPSKKLIACLELHTYSSLKKDFLPEYAGSMDTADFSAVYFNDHVIELKKLERITKNEVVSAFKNKDLKVFNESTELSDFLFSFSYENTILLLMSSGNFAGLDIESLKTKIAQQS
jgi:UDP-N-acetylmuramate: L-alanyl-gamma-D-glutamyl-meso-diaminopimelate ligase